MEPTSTRHARNLNIIFDIGVDRESDTLIFDVYVGDKKRIPAHLYQSCFHESSLHKWRRWILLSLFWFLLPWPLFRIRKCRISVKKRNSESYLNSWKIEDALLILKECGFCLYARVNDGSTWTPFGVFCDLLQSGRISHSMPVFYQNREHNQFVLLSSEEVERLEYPTA